MTILILALLLNASAARADAVLRKDGKSVLMDFVMTVGNTDFYKVPTFSADGSFKVYLRKSSVPVDAPACLSNIEVDMPPTPAKAPKADVETSAKKELFEKIMALRESNTVHEVKITVDLTKEAKVTGREPLKLRLKRCRMTFSRSMFST